MYGGMFEKLSVKFVPTEEAAIRHIALGRHRDRCVPTGAMSWWVWPIVLKGSARPSQQSAVAATRLGYVLDFGRSSPKP